MIDRRGAVKLMAGAAAAGLSAGAPILNAAPKPKIVGAVRREETIKRFDFFTGFFDPTWAGGDVQYLSVLECMDRAVPPKFTYFSRIFKLTGDPGNLEIQDLPSYPPTPWRNSTGQAEFRGGSCLYVNGTIYQQVSTPNHAYYNPDGTFWPGWQDGLGVKIIYSTDEGKSWCNQDGSPARWEKWEERSGENLLFYTPNPSTPKLQGSFLQMGPNYSWNRDGFVYLHADNASAVSSPDEMILLRVPTAKILDRSAYEFYSGRLADGTPTWTSDIARRSAVHRFPPGWTIDGRVVGQAPSGWSMSVVYNKALGVYMMVGQGIGASKSGGWYGKPSYLGIWVAETPWGPFRQIHEETAWLPGRDAAARAMNPRIPPKWISSDGKSFWLVWGDTQFVGPHGETEFPDKPFMEMTKNIKDDAEMARFMYQWAKSYHPCTKFNVQRVDLTVA